MSYVALYRKARPRIFDEIKGQDPIVRALRNQVITDRLQHAYLFTGTRGTGKTSAAKILARAVNCEHPENGNPCGECSVCRNITDGTSMNVIEIDAASNNGVDNIRDIIDEVRYRPTEGRYKVYIIDEVHMLSAGAFNALLKTLEEPPEYVIFILATTEAGRIPVTILSRCQRYDFRRIGSRQIALRMKELLQKEDTEAEDKALDFIARAADGSMRDALSLLDRCIAFYMGEKLTYEKVLKALGEADHEVFSGLTRKLIRGDTAGVIRDFSNQISEGAEVSQFISDYVWYLRNVLIVSETDSKDAEELIDVSSEQLEDLKKISGELDSDTVARYIRVLSELMNRMRFASDRRVLAETSLILLSKAESDEHEDAWTGRIRQLELKVEELMAGGFVPAGSFKNQAKKTDEEPADEGEKVLLPDAAPDDLKAIAASWDRLIADMPGGKGRGLLKNQLQHHAHVQYNEETLENRLFIELKEGLNREAARVIAADEYSKEELEKYLARKTGKHVPVTFYLAKDAKPGSLKTIDTQAYAEAQMPGVQVEVIPDSEFPEDPF